jgi:hypothetical protein
MKVLVLTSSFLTFRLTILLTILIAFSHICCHATLGAVLKISQGKAVDVLQENAWNAYRVWGFLFLADPEVCCKPTRHFSRVTIILNISFKLWLRPATLSKFLSSTYLPLSFNEGLTRSTRTALETCTNSGFGFTGISNPWGQVL